MDNLQNKSFYSFAEKHDFPLSPSFFPPELLAIMINWVSGLLHWLFIDYWQSFSLLLWRTKMAGLIVAYFLFSPDRVYVDWMRNPQ